MVLDIFGCTITYDTWLFYLFDDVYLGVALVALGKFPEMSEAADWVLGDMPNDIDELVAIEEVSKLYHTLFVQSGVYLYCVVFV